MANTGTLASPVVITLFSAATRAALEDPPALIPNRQLVGFSKVHTASGQSQQVCFQVSDADVAIVADDGARVAYAGGLTLSFFDGASTATVPAVVSVRRTISVLPPVDNPPPPCCSGANRTCC